MQRGDCPRRVFVDSCIAFSIGFVMRAWKTPVLFLRRAIAPFADNKMLLGRRRKKIWKRPLRRAMGFGRWGVIFTSVECFTASYLWGFEHPVNGFCGGFMVGFLNRIRKRGLRRKAFKKGFRFGLFMFGIEGIGGFMRSPTAFWDESQVNQPPQLPPEALETIKKQKEDQEKQQAQQPYR